MARHRAWQGRAEPAWVPLGVGVSFFCKPCPGEIVAAGAAEAARVVGGLLDGRADLERYGVDPSDMGLLTDLEQLAGFSVLVSAVTIARRVVTDWRGFIDDEGEVIPFDEDGLIDALRLGAPDGGPPLLGPFMAWVQRPREPVNEDCARLRKVAAYEHSEYGMTQCGACEQFDEGCSRGGTEENGQRCPRIEFAPLTVPGRAALASTRSSGVWLRGGLAGVITGLDYARCLLFTQSQGCQDNGAVMRCLQAIEAGAISAHAERNAPTS